MVQKDGTILASATIKGQDYLVVQTKRGSSSIWSARDTIVNLSNGNRKELTRKEWYKLFNKFK